MHDAQLEQDLSSLLAGRADLASKPSLRRYAVAPDREAIEATPTDAATLAAPAAEEGAEAPRPALLVERQQTHGNFTDNAIISQAIKDLLRSSPGWLGLSAIEREAMDMIALKFSRILSGRSMEKQHWEDVRGYAALVEEKCF